MNIIENVFKNRKAFVAYITAGHRGLSYTQEAALSLIEGGVDILEIGVPFSDPMADGPVIQQAMSDALNNSVDFDGVLRTIENIKKVSQTPIVLFTYLNPLLAQGLQISLNNAANAGVDALLVVDLPLEESAEYFEQCNTYALNPIGLLSPTTPAERIKTIAESAQGFLYYVCRNGTTGVKDSLPQGYEEKISVIKANASLPVVSGFGIGNREMAKNALECADGFVVGSAFVNAINQDARPEDLKQLALNIDPR